jgi:nucleoid-associated protein YejK
LLGDLARLYWSTNHKEEAIEAASKAKNLGLVKFFEENNSTLLEEQLNKKFKDLKDSSEYISQLWMGIDYAKCGVRDKALQCFNNAIALKEVAITLLLMGHYEFLNIKYLSLALMKRKISMMVNF